jgi:hypothetical protein
VRSLCLDAYLAGRFVCETISLGDVENSIWLVGDDHDVLVIDPHLQTGSTDEATDPSPVGCHTPVLASPATRAGGKPAS